MGGWGQLYANFFWIFGFFLYLQGPLDPVVNEATWIDITSVIQHSQQLVNIVTVVPIHVSPNYQSNVAFVNYYKRVIQQ